MALGLGGAVVSVGILGILAWGLTADLPDPGALISRTAPDATKIYDRQGKLLFEVLDPRAGRRTRVPLGEVPDHLQAAVVAVEDAGFYSNSGIDARGVARAALQAVRQGRIVSGASTITQQLARLVLLSAPERHQRTLSRKLREMYLALGITRRYGKPQILEMYLNEVYFGQLAYGVDAAARTYFGVPVRELDLAESALLAGLIQSPAAYNPLVHLDAARDRQGVALERMVKTGAISRAEAEAAIQEPLRLAGGNVPLAAPHFVAYVTSLLEATYGAEAVHRGGLQVITSLDLDLQRRAEAVVARRLRDLNRPRPGVPDHNARDGSLVALDPESGQVLAMVGSADYFDEDIDGAVNIALALRQPGSAIKPITYAAAFDPDRWGAGGGPGAPGAPALPFTAATVLSDVPTSFLTRENEPYRPLNYDRMWHGPISLRRALATSSNMVAVKVLDAVGTGAMIDTAEALGITSLSKRQDFGLALTLGGGEVRLLELTAAYAAFANGGHRVEPNPILAVLDPGEFEAAGGDFAPYHAASTVTGEAAISPQVAYIITDILADDEARLPAFGEGSVLALGRPAAAKTGTTTDFRDNWTLGYTPDLAVGVWVGNADNSPMKFISGITGAGPIWHDFMVEAEAARPVRTFEGPPGLVTLEVCATSGDLPTPACRRRRTELFIRGTEPTRRDTSYRSVAIDAASGLSWAEGCGGPRVERVFRILPPDARDWGRRNGVPEPPTETCRGEAVAAAPGQARDGARARASGTPRAVPPLSLVLPAPNSVFALSPALPRAAQRIEIRAQLGPGARLTAVTLLVDGRPLATVREPPFRGHWSLEAGVHSAVAEGRGPDGRLVRSDAVRFTVVDDAE
ncbi:MAG: transglycosylase domain-containing protein [Anaerolineae bacterium]